MTAETRGRAEGVRAPPDFGRSVNPISTRGAHYVHHITKGGFFSESAIRYRIRIWNIIFWRFGDLKNTSHFLKKKTLYVPPGFSDLQTALPRLQLSLAAVRAV